MPRSASSLVSLRLTVDLGMPSSAAAFDRLRFSTTLPNTSRASRSKGRFCSISCSKYATGCCTCASVLTISTAVSVGPSVIGAEPEEGLHESRQPGDETRERTLDRRLSRTRPRTRVTRRLRFGGVLREGTRARLPQDLAV